MKCERYPDATYVRTLPSLTLYIRCSPLSLGRAPDSLLDVLDPS